MKIDKIEIIGEFNHLQIRIENQLFDANGNPANSSFERDTILCGDFEKAKNYGGNVEKLSVLLWDEELVNNYKKSIEVENKDSEENEKLDSEI